MEHIPTYTEQRILCASCGTTIAPNPANLCVNCIRNEVDITEGIPKQGTLHFCKGCERYLQPPNIWVNCALESRELLALCLKKLKGLSKVRLIDAGFVWTEPHSRRIKVKLTIQKEVFASTILQQVFVVEFIVSGQQCEECTRVAAQLTWKAAVQVRQKVPHKRTFLWLEQLILKHNAHKDTTNIKEARDGIDFYYANRSHAIRMVEFLQAITPLRLKTSEQLISTDIHAGTANYKFTYSVELVPICKDDLVCLPMKVARSLSNISPLALCTRVGNSLQLLDFNSLRVGELRGAVFWESPFTSLCDAKELVEFYVIDIQPEGVHNGKYMLATAEVALSNDLNTTWLVRTHLGHILRPGDHVMGYNLVNANFNNTEYDIFSQAAQSRGGLPDVVLVRKAYPNARRKRRTRNWKLQQLAKEEEEGVVKAKSEKAKAELDYEMFLRDLEEDPELRSMVNLYKDAAQSNKVVPIIESENQDDDEMMDEDDEPEEDFPEINMDELLEEMEGMNIQDDEMA
ncbi:NMD3-domain-containing protein [Polychytrium aggregatum]|uniref:NMD3-domain-containing protein n=1 Tax=Polychytrium aggregatum TaxID=110093 RepID=UPI0022FEE02E|nr:NMD3-domain-containing protein [Polychytrium aggregatum]KAI9204521.1 NMD3-domain-containing protein [Polychytrium aggregatum]